jgi:hypothetical protein
MTGENLERPESRSDAGTPSRAERIPRRAQQEQFLHLVRLAWELHSRGLNASVDLPRGESPRLRIPRAPEPLRIMASTHKGTWFFTWGRGAAQRVRALAGDAADRIWEVAQ